MNVVLPPKPRLIAYVILAVVTVLLIPAVGIWYTSAGEPIPQVLVRIGAIASFVAGNALVLSALNVNKGDKFLNADSIKEQVLDPANAMVPEVLDAAGDVDEDEDLENAGLDVILAPKE